MLSHIMLTKSMSTYISWSTWFSEPDSSSLFCWVFWLLISTQHMQLTESLKRIQTPGKKKCKQAVVSNVILFMKTAIVLLQLFTKILPKCSITYVNTKLMYHLQWKQIQRLKNFPFLTFSHSYETWTKIHMGKIHSFLIWTFSVMSCQVIGIIVCSEQSYEDIFRPIIAGKLKKKNTHLKVTIKQIITWLFRNSAIK